MSNTTIKKQIYLKSDTSQKKERQRIISANQIKDILFTTMALG